MVARAESSFFAMPAPERDGDYFRVTNWTVFVPGYHKGRLYTAADCRQVVANFRRLSVGPDAFVKAKGKIGHDDDQSIAKSLGLPAAGRITACREAPGGGFAIDIENIPCVGIGPDGEKFDFYDAVAKGLYPDGSVELVWDVPDPDDPAKTIPGPVLEGIAFLGEEPPGVRGLPSPRAEFSRRERGEHRTILGRRCTLRRVRFSEVVPVRDQLLQQLKDMGLDVGDPGIAGLSDEALQALINQLGGESFAAAMKKKFAAAPVTPPPVPATGQTDDLGQKFAAFAEDCTKRMGAMEQTLQGLQGMQADVQQAVKFARDYPSERKAQKLRTVTELVNQAAKEGRLQPWEKDDQIELGVGKDDVTKFAAGTGAGKDGKTPFDLWKTALLARPANPLLAETMADTGADAELDAFSKKALAATGRGRATLDTLKS